METHQIKALVIKTTIYIAFFVLWLGLCNFVTLFNGGIYASGALEPNGLQALPMSNHGKVVYITVWQSAQQILYFTGLLVGFGTLLAVALHVRYRYNIKVFWR